MWGVEGAWFKREGICVCLPQTHIGVQQKPTQHCKAILLQLKHTHTHTHTPSADSRYYTAESNTTLQSNSPPVKTHTQTQRQLQPLFSWSLQIGPSLSVSLFFFFFLPPLNLPLLTWSLPLFAIKSSVSTSAIHFKFLPI